ncbi:Glu/Leu/Phe/Val dehydrogenase dimerization domain-containing protein [Nonomuraea sp. NPDC000554]|uniref:Leu/Phe/Val dehydrogenase n=1 Tax=Nonomuraea sp. NPDC000554 TaxID=3154259 RepID=UPI00331A4189
MFDLIGDGGHELVMFCNHRDSGLRAVIAVHDTTLGPALGGVRMLPYASDEEAVRDALRLAKAMTYKASLAGLNLGGGKSVIIADPSCDKTEALFRTMGRYVQTLGGRYIPGVDSGTTQDDLRVIALEADHVSCVGADPSPFTAHGVHAAIGAAMLRLHGSSDMAGRKVAVQGVGHVGAALAGLLARDGVELVLSDVRMDAAEALAGELGASVAEPDRIAAVPCDVFAPCALGGVIDDRSLETLDAAVVAGAANNVLAEPRHGVELHRRGVLYAPDYCANAGGIIFLAEEMLGHDAPAAERRVRGIARTLATIWQRSSGDDLPPEAVAEHMAEERIAAIRRLGPPPLPSRRTY